MLIREPGATASGCVPSPAAFRTPVGATNGTRSSTAFRNTGKLVFTFTVLEVPLASPSHHLNLYPGWAVAVTVTSVFTG